MRNPHILRTLPILHFFELFKKIWNFIWFVYCLNRFITLRGVQMILEKIKIQKYFKITKGTKNVRNPKILRTLHIFHFFELFKNFWDFKWLGYCLDRIITLRGCSMGAKKNKNLKILKNYQRYKECEESSHSSYPLHTPLLWTFKKQNWDFICLGYCVDRFTTLRWCLNDAWKNKNPKILKKLLRIQRIGGFLTFFLPSPFSTSLNFSNSFGTLYGLDIV